MALPGGWGDIGQPLDKIDYVPEDKNWIEFLPEGSSVISATGYGGSFWSQTGKIVVRLMDGTTEAYLIKISRDSVGKQMAEGEYESMRLLHSIVPNIVPRPIGWGTYESDPDTHFYLCDFVEIYDELPDPVEFCQDIAEMHRKSLKNSSHSKFGFHVVTCNETNPQYTKWTSSWEKFFIELLDAAIEDESQVHGPDPEIEEMRPVLLEKVCPRLLRPLETEGRTIRPCLVHGDLWDGNIAVHAKTGQPVIFDASALWAHNEYELHIWRGTRYRIGRTFMKEYFYHFPRSPPEDDYNDRNLLYSLMADLHSSALFPKSPRFRNLLIISMRKLVDKFHAGYTGTARRKDIAEADEQTDA